MAREYEGQVSFIGVAGNANLGHMQEFVEEHQLQHFPQAATENGDLWAKWGVGYQPAFVLIDAAGEVVYKAVRPDLEEVRAQLDALAA